MDEINILGNKDVPAAGTGETVMSVMGLMWIAAFALLVCMVIIYFMAVQSRKKYDAMLSYFRERYPEKVRKLLGRDIYAGKALSISDQRRILLLVNSLDLPHDDDYTRLKQECVVAGRRFKLAVPVCSLSICGIILLLLTQYKNRLTHSQGMVEMVVFWGLFLLLVLLFTFFKVRRMKLK